MVLQLIYFDYEYADNALHITLILRSHTAGDGLSPLLMGSRAVVLPGKLCLAKFDAVIVITIMPLLVIDKNVF